jgi:NAD(P)-dependent dehydrogenase (short-subunit alcohol dehydrogenase family)
MGRFEGQNLLITGAAAGIGQALALGFAREGARVVIADFKSAQETVRLIREAGGEADEIRCDIRVEDEVMAMGRRAAELLDGRIDLLVNNAGFNGKAQLVRDMKLDDWNYTLGVNLTGTMLVCREVSPYMMARGSGAIVNVASNVARRGLPYRADYVCSKWALLGFTQTLALELVASGIRVNAVCPGPVSGDRIEQIVQMHAEAEGKPFEEIHRAWADAAPMKRFIEPEEVCRVVMFLCSDDSSAMTGQALNITGGFIMT